jgi:ribosome recycling factor
MDFAFQSRIKFAIRFDRMSDSIRGAIWEDILENLPDSGGESRRLLDKAKNSWSLKTKYNGRHIRNVVWNARILAAPSEGKKKLTLSEAIEEVIDDTDNFIEQIDDAKKEEEQRLLGEGWGPG